VNPRRLSHFASKSVQGCDLQSVEEKKSESHKDFHRKDMSPLTQGLNYRSSCDDLILYFIKSMWPLAKLCVRGGGIQMCEKSRLTQCRAMKFSNVIPRKIVKIVATRGQILRRKCTKFNFGWGSAPDPAGRAYSAPPDPLTGL